MQPDYFDIHSHLNFAAFDADRGEVVSRMREAGVSCINVGTQLDTSKRAIELAHTYEHMYAIVGLHPVHTESSHHDEKEIGEGGNAFRSRAQDFDNAAFKKLALDAKVVALGECGLDYYHLNEDSIKRQKEIFISHIELAAEIGKPLMLHIRSNKERSAYADAIDILKRYPEVKGNVHFFAGTLSDARQFLELGHTLSFTGVVTFAKEYKELVEFVSLDRMMAETDCPFVAPVPHRGTRNEPAYVVEVYAKIAEIKNLSLEKVAEQIRQNVRRVFNI